MQGERARLHTGHVRAGRGKDAPRKRHASTPEISREIEEKSLQIEEDAEKPRKKSNYHDRAESGFQMEAKKGSKSIRHKSRVFVRRWHALKKALNRNEIHQKHREN